MGKNKTPKLYYKKGLTTVYKLNNFPYSYDVVIGNWNAIVKAYMRKNKEYFEETDKIKKAVKSIFGKVPEFRISKEGFESMQKELGVKDNYITIYFESSTKPLVKIFPPK